MAGRHRRQALITQSRETDCKTAGSAYSGVMKAVFGILSLGLAVSGCGSPTPAPQPSRADDDPAASAAALFDSGTLDLIGAKCMAVLDLPPNADRPENRAVHRRWQTWFERRLQPELADQMLTLNRQALANTPEPTLIAAADFCRTKIEEVAPQTAPAI